MKRYCQQLVVSTMMLTTGFLLVGCNSTNDDNNPLDDPIPTINPPSAPADLLGVAYSSSAIELAWSASTDDGTVVEYQIYRNGILVATLDTLHFFENDLTAGSTHTYRVLAVDDEGNLSGPSELTITTLDESSIISEANYSIILPHVIAIANGGVFNDLPQIVNSTDASWLSGANFEDIAGLTFVDQANDQNDIWRIYTYECEFGGAYEYHTDTFIQFGGHFKGYYDACQISRNNITGDFDRLATVNKGAPYNEILASQYNLSVKNDLLGSTRNLTGSLKVDNSQIDNRYSLTGASYFEHNLMWSEIVSGIELEVYATDEQPLAGYAVPFSRTFDASFNVQGPQTDDKPLTVTIEFETTDEVNLNYQTGSLEVTAGDGTSMLMDLENGDPDTFQLSFFSPNDSSALTVVWSDEYRLHCFQTPTFDTLLTACSQGDSQVAPGT